MYINIIYIHKILKYFNILTADFRGSQILEIFEVGHVIFLNLYINQTLIFSI